MTATRYLSRPCTWAIALLVGTSAMAGCSTASEPDQQSPEAGAGTAGAAGPAGSSGGSAADADSAQGGESSAGSSSTASGESHGGEAPGGVEAPPAVDGKSVYTLECRGDSKDCNRASVPCFGVGGTPEAALGYACSNRCRSIDDCSQAPTGVEAQVDCVPFTSASHCMLVCKQETLEFACPAGMSCYVYPGSPIGYCLWQ